MAAELPDEEEMRKSFPLKNLRDIMEQVREVGREELIEEVLDLIKDRASQGYTELYWTPRYKKGVEGEMLVMSAILNPHDVQPRYIWRSGECEKFVSYFRKLGYTVEMLEDITYVSHRISWVDASEGHAAASRHLADENSRDSLTALTKDVEAAIRIRALSGCDFILVANSFYNDSVTGYISERWLIPSDKMSHFFDYSYGSSIRWKDSELGRLFVEHFEELGLKVGPPTEKGFVMQW